MNEVVFIQRSRLGRMLFTLRDKDIEVTSHALGFKTQATFTYSQLSPDYALRAVRAWRGIAYLSLAAAGCFRLAYEMAFGTWLPDGLKVGLATYPAMFGLMFLCLAIRYVPRIEFFCFNTVWGQPAFMLVRERAQTAECESFVQALLDRIEGVPVETGSLRPRESAVRVSQPEIDPEFASAEYRWICALVCGALSLAMPALVWIDRGLEFFVFPGQAATVSAALLMVFASFQKRERRRAWSLLSVALCAGSFVLAGRR